jgi:hypothetical protein
VCRSGSFEYIDNGDNNNANENSISPVTRGLGEEYEICDDGNTKTSQLRKNGEEGHKKAIHTMDVSYQGDVEVVLYE